MSLENFMYRTDPLFLRNGFKGSGKYGIPMLPRFDFYREELESLKLIGFDIAKAEKDKNFDRIVHFFLYDYKFESIWENPEKFVENLKKYKAVLTPDFSMYTEMPPAMQIYNTFRNRWCGSYLASKGIRVIPTVSWSNEKSFDFCFDGIPSESAVAVSTYMASEHGGRKSDQKEFFLKGYNELLNRINPEFIICYHEPFPEMEGDIIYVNYEESSWKYRESKSYVPSKYVNFICGNNETNNCGIIIKRCGYVLNETQKGMGSAYGGNWRPHPDKPNDKRYLGNPGEINKSIMKNGDEYWTKIGEDGRAIMERHFTDHNRPDKHSNPHDHIINWDNNTGFPLPGSHINYSDGNIPEFKNFEEVTKMNSNERKKFNIIPTNTIEQNRFNTVDEFKWAMKCNSEVQFEYKGKDYSITHPEGLISVCEGNKYSEAKDYETADEALNYEIDGSQLRKIIKDINVWERTI